MAASSELEKSVTYDNIKVVYDSYTPEKSDPKSPALIFIHGWTCDNALWYHQSPIYTAHRSILLDLPGHGSSAAPEVDYTHELYANAVNAILERESLTSVILIGHSMGGPISTEFLRLYPEKVKGLVYIDSFFHLPSAYMPYAHRKAFVQTLMDDETFAKYLHQAFFVSKTPEDAKKQIVETMTSASKHVRYNAIVTTGQGHTWRWDEVYDVPALHLVTPGYYKAMDPAWQKHMPGLETRVWDGNGHFLFLEEPERFNAEVGAWIKEKVVE